jgi:hypothetical protein
LNPEKTVEFILPLAEQGLRHDEQDAGGGPLGTQLRDYEAGFNSLAEAHFIGENAAAFWDSLEREDDRVDLVRIWIDAALPLRSGIALLLVGAA